MAYLDEKHSTIRCTDCELLVNTELLLAGDVPRCFCCTKYCTTLRTLVNRSERQKADDCDRTNPSSHTPFQSLNTPEKARRYRREHELRRSCERRIARLSEKLSEATKQRGFCEDDGLHSDLSQIMSHNSQTISETLPSGSFGRIFWDSQRDASLKDPRQMRWDPVMVRWCLYLRHLSSTAYETLRESGAIKLPSQRTLRDYTHHTKATVGFSKEVDELLRSAAKLTSCPDREKCVVIIMDEMHLREDLAFDKHTGKE